MLVAHLPSGYLLARGAGLKRQALVATLIGAVFPDIDMLWFLFVDHGTVHHHHYLPHLPGFWLLVALITLPVVWRLRPSALSGFLAGVFLHLILDTLAGRIAWAWPFDATLFALVTVPPTQSNWVLSFIWHWTFLVEVAITAAAIFAYLRQKA